MDDERAVQLRQLANIVIDAYLTRDEQFTPKFGDDKEAVMYLTRPEDSADHPRLRTNVWYDRSDYEETVTSGEQKEK